jgi:hypothetical protein
MTTTPPTRIGKTTVAASVGSIFVQLRQDGRVVAIDDLFGRPSGLSMDTG